jgi:hypothetical protein
VDTERFVSRLASARIGATFNFYPDGAGARLRRQRNVVPTHPGTEASNRRPTREEIVASRPFLEELAENRRLIAVGRLAARVTGAPYIRHPSHGGAAEFRTGLLQFCAGGRQSPPF